MKLAPDGRDVVWLYLIILLLVGAAFLYTLLPTLSPFILFVALMILAAPFTGTDQHRRIVIALGLLLVVWFLLRLGSLLAPFVMALVIAYILDPLVDRLQARGMKRGIAVAALILPLFLIAAVVLVFGVPAVVNQAGELIDQIPAAVQKFVDWVQVMRARLERMPLFRSGGFASALDSFSPERLSAALQEQQAQIARRVWDAVVGFGRGLTVAAAIIGYVVLVPVLVIYLLIDFDRVTGFAGTLLPVHARERWMPLIHEYDRLLSRYFRGQVIAALIVGVLTWLGLLIADFPYSGLVGAVAGIFNVVPYLGLVVSLIPALLIAFLSGSILLSLLKIAVVFGIVQLIDGTITGPRIVGSSVGLHPVWVILALALGSFLFGFAGLLLAIPAGVLIKLLLQDGITRYRNSAFYHGESALGPEAENKE